jgi:hypothetical protein
LAAKVALAAARLLLAISTSTSSVRAGHVPLLSWRHAMPRSTRGVVPRLASICW